MSTEERVPEPGNYKIHNQVGAGTEGNVPAGFRLLKSIDQGSRVLIIVPVDEWNKVGTKGDKSVYISNFTKSKKSDYYVGKIE